MGCVDQGILSENFLIVSLDWPQKTRKLNLIEWCSSRLLLIQCATFEGSSWGRQKKRKKSTHGN
jgi:hypothetical protein